jgi:multicomponent Na+:H+ antiporter subunit C
VIGFALIEYAINLLFALVGFRSSMLAPIITKVDMPHRFVDPIPQALVLTAIVIALGTTALMLSVALRIYNRYKTFDIAKIKKLKG